MQYDIARVGETAYPVFFTTHAQTGAMVAPSTAFEITDGDSDIRVYKDNSATQRTSGAGFTMVSPFDAIVGLHLVTFDLSDNTDAGFWAVGSRYTVVLTADETVDGLSVLGTVIGRFRIMAAENTAGEPVVDVKRISGDATAADNAEAFFDGTGYAGTGNVIPSVTTVTGNVNGSVASVTGAVGSVTGAVGSVTGAVGSVAAGGITAASFGAAAIDAAAIAPNAIGASELAADAVAEIADAVWDEAASGHLVAGSFGVQCGTDIDDILVDTGTTLQAEVDGIQADTEDIQARLPTALVSGRIDASVGEMAAAVVTAGVVAAGAIDADALAADAVAEIADGVWDEALSGHTTAGTAGEAMNTLGSGTINNAAAQKIADTLLNRSLASARASGVGDAQLTRSLIGALAKLVNRVDVNDTRTTLRIYDETDATVAWTQTITTDPNASPINSVDTA